MKIEPSGRVTGIRYAFPISTVNKSENRLLILRNARILELNVNSHLSIFDGCYSRTLINEVIRRMHSAM